MQLDRQTRREIRELLIPHVQDVNARRALIQEAFYGTELSSQIEVNKDSHAFATDLIERSIAFGEVEPKKHALIALLDELNQKVGHDRKREIQSIKHRLLSTSEETPIDNIKEPPITQPTSKNHTLWYLIGGTVLLIMVIGAVGYVAFQAGIFDTRDAVTLVDEAEDIYFSSESDKYETVIQLTTRAIQRDLNNAPAYMYRGRSRWHIEDNTAALADFNNALRIDPNNVQGYLFRGRIFAHMKQYHLSIADFTMGINVSTEDNPENRYLYHERGRSYRDTGEISQAITDYSEGIRSMESINSHIWYLYSDRGIAHFEQGNYEQAIDDFKAETVINPGYATVYRRLGEAYQAQGECTQAIINYQKAIDRNDNAAVTMLAEVQALVENNSDECLSSGN